MRTIRRHRRAAADEDGRPSCQECERLAERRGPAVQAGGCDVREARQRGEQEGGAEDRCSDGEQQTRRAQQEGRDVVVAEDPVARGRDQGAKGQGEERRRDRKGGDAQQDVGKGDANLFKRGR
jgi:hypothetical protein